MKRRGHAEEAILKVVYDNPLAFFRQCKRWQEWPEEAERNGQATNGAAAATAARVTVR